MRECPRLPIHIKSLVRPLSEVAIFMEHNFMHALRNARSFGMLQLRRITFTTLSHATGGKACILCGAAEHGFPHILKSCRALSEEKAISLGSVDAVSIMFSGFQQLFKKLCRSNPLEHWQSMAFTLVAEFGLMVLETDSKSLTQTATTLQKR